MECVCGRERQADRQTETETDTETEGNHMGISHRESKTPKSKNGNKQTYTHIHMSPCSNDRNYLKDRKPRETIWKVNNMVRTLSNHDTTCATYLKPHGVHVDLDPL